MSGNSEQVVSVTRRPPYEREQSLAARRAALVAEGRPVDAFDAVAEEFREQDRQVLAGMVRQAELVVASFCTEHAETLSLLPTAVAQGLIVRATAAYLFASGVMVPAPPSGGEEGWFPLEYATAVPAHLRPDVERAVRGYSRMLSALHTAHGAAVPVGTPGPLDPPTVERS